MSTRLSYNFRTHEFYKASYDSLTVTSATSFRAGQDESQALLIGATFGSLDQVYELDEGTSYLDGTGTFSRYFDIDWTTFDLAGTKYLTGAEFTFTKGRDCRVRISVGVDRSSKFQYPKWFDLKGNDPDEEIVRASYNIPSPIYGTWFRVRVELFHDAGTNVVRLLDFTPELIKMQPASVDTPKLPGPTRS